jgi:hypothetical protein
MWQQRHESGCGNIEQARRWLFLDHRSATNVLVAEGRNGSNQYIEVAIYFNSSRCGLDGAGDAQGFAAQN